MNRRSSRLYWAHRYERRLAVTDVAVVVWAVSGAYLTRFGTADARLVLGELAPSYLLISVLLIVAWASILSFYDSRDPKVIGLGSEEYRRVLDASVRLFGVIAIAAFLLRAEIARGLLLLAFPAGVLGLLASRWMWRKWLHLQRQRGEWSDRVVVAGSATQVRHLVRELQRERFAGYRVIGVCAPDDLVGAGAPLREQLGVPVLGDPEDVAAVAKRVDADAVAVVTSERFDSGRLRALGWELEAHGIDLVVAPSLVDVAGPRVHTRPVGGLPLLHVEAPRYEGATRIGKTLFDLCLAGLLLVLLSPVLLLVAVLVKATSRGPVLYRQRRIGLNGEPFDMLKFRSMVQDADQRLPQLMSMNEAEGPLFKIRDDPRVTPLGRIMRMFSIDELPQLLNVLNGTMSLVGPRPPLPSEAETYGPDVARRMLVRPGMTGLWQVSGRSNLSWEDSVRLDLFYVENWSIAEDVLILGKTVRAVLGRSGAY